MLAVVAWAIVIACLLWLPAHYLLAPAGAADHRIRLLATMLAMFVVLIVGWRGFRSICAFFHAE